jgi:hypothetical protein
VAGLGGVVAFRFWNVALVGFQRAASGARVVGLLLEYRYQSPLRVLELLLALIHFKVGTQVMSLLASAWVNRGLLNQAFIHPLLSRSACFVI